MKEQKNPYVYKLKKSSRKLNIDDDESLLTLYNLPLMKKRGIQELHGIATAVIYDGVVDDNEINLIISWLSKNKEVHDEWPVSRLIVLLQEILEDGIVTSDERKELLAFLSGIATTSNPDDSIAENIFLDDVPIIFTDKSFMFTGKLQFGGRKKAVNEVIKRGGECPGGGYKLWLDYLVVGELGQNCWKYKKYGTKIESCMNALELQKANTAIIREKDLINTIIEHPVF